MLAVGFSAGVTQIVIAKPTATIPSIVSKIPKHPAAIHTVVSITIATIEINQISMSLPEERLEEVFIVFKFKC